MRISGLLLLLAFPQLPPTNSNPSLFHPTFPGRLEHSSGRGRGIFENETPKLDSLNKKKKMLKQETKIICNHENSFGQHYGFIALTYSRSLTQKTSWCEWQGIYISTKLDENLNWHLICNFQAPRNPKMSATCTIPCEENIFIVSELYMCAIKLLVTYKTHR